MLKELGKDDDNPSTSSSPIQEEMHIIPFQKGPYTMTELKRLLRERQKVEAIPSITQDLKNEIDNLKKEISFLKSQNLALDQRVSALENQKLLPIEDSQTLPEGDFLKTLEEEAHQHFYAKVTLLIDYNYKREFTALIDSGADYNCIQEGMIPLSVVSSVSIDILDVDDILYTNVVSSMSTDILDANDILDASVVSSISTDILDADDILYANIVSSMSTDILDADDILNASVVSSVSTDILDADDILYASIMSSASTNIE
ncbi:hypothetical protein T459_33790 [Capsicum annuum]|uniref:Peptidase A2 domain-containing protein n=1 Tax=Capsicum annuum TaxID=4072 RepID=A0A2G2XXX4_CAPAN|nr:hypothetical protein FXO37_08363 [Capsicum annuum]PHT62364.1 hypothetical protein T459_33790 [Capsicum annuum]